MIYKCYLGIEKLMMTDYNIVSQPDTALLPLWLIIYNFIKIYLICCIYTECYIYGIRYAAYTFKYLPFRSVPDKKHLAFHSELIPEHV